MTNHARSPVTQERINKRCATDGCGGQPTERFEAGGVGSIYCSGCRAQIEAQSQNRKIGAPGWTAYTFEGERRQEHDAIMREITHS